MSKATIGLAELFRSKSGQLLASLTYFAGDLQMAEDALQDAFEQAASVWPTSGIPDNPSGWLHVVAKRKLIDKLRHNQSRNEQQKRQLIQQTLTLHVDDQQEADHDVPDERLRLIFTCCHPALSEPARVALTLRTLCGLSVREIARAYLTSEIAMGQRITRAKKKIKMSGIAYEVPSIERLPSRLPSVLKIIYLIFNESYSAYEGQTLTKQALANEAIRLAYLMIKLMPTAEVYGLTALMVAHNSRRLSRRSDAECFIPLERQDRTLWDSEAVAEANRLINEAMAFNDSGPYQIQAAISILHNQAKRWEQTDWPQIVLLYSHLYLINPSAVIALNLNFAKAQYGQIDDAYQAILALEHVLASYQPYYAAKAEIETQLGLSEIACVSLEKAIGLSQNDSQRDFLKTKYHLLVSSLE